MVAAGDRCASWPGFLEKKAQSDPKRIVFPESDDDRIIEAVSIIAKEKIAHPFLVGNAEAIQDKAHKLAVNLQGVEIRRSK